MPKVIYRVQSEEGTGPYTDMMSTDWVDMDENDMPIMHSMENGRPGPYDEGLSFTDLKPSHLYGFKSLDMLLRWFTSTELLRLIIDHGFNVYKMTVEDYEFDLKCQTIFSENSIISQEIFAIDAYI